MAKKKKRTSIRTASANAQELMRVRLQALADDPLIVLPTADPLPKPLAKLESKLQQLQKKGPSFLSKRDKGVLGAVAHAMELAKANGYPRMVDHKVAGQRKFYLQRGHVARFCSLGVQNHDDPRALLLAYAIMAKEHNLHFHAHGAVSCSLGAPPDAWWQYLGETTSVELRVDDGAQCLHPDRPRVRIAHRGGGEMRICGPCGKKAKSMHRVMANHYVGPRRRQPFEVVVRLPDGSLHEPEREVLAEYRAGVRTEEDLVRQGLAAWRNQGGTRFVIDETVYDDQDAFLAALPLQSWEHSALQAMTKDGHVGEKSGVAAIIDEHKDRLADGALAILDDPTFVEKHLNQAPRDLLRACHEEAKRRETLEALPKVQPSGPIGTFAWRMVQANMLAEPQAVKSNMAGVPKQHAYAFALALGEQGLESQFHAEEQAAGESLCGLAKALLAAPTRDGLQAYLEESGSGESC